MLRAIPSHAARGPVSAAVRAGVMALKTSGSTTAQPSTATRSLLLARFYAKEYPKHVKVPMPALSPTMTTGNVGKYAKKIGDQVSMGDILVELETDKATMDFEIQEEGYLAKILVPTGTADVPINKVIAILAENKDDVPAFADYTEASSPAAAAAAPTAAPVPKAAAPQAAAPQAAAPQASGDGSRIFISPVARALAEEKNIDIASIKGTGPDGRIQKEDVLNYKPSAVAPAAAAPAAAAPIHSADFTDLPATKMRQVIAQRLTQSKQQVPHYYLTVDVNVDKVLQLRARWNAKGENSYKLSVNDFVIKASAMALIKVPQVNSSWMGDFIRQFNHADISVAVATEAGLITPIVTGADTKGLVAISEQVKALAAKARLGKLLPNEYQGGSFSISNLGMYNVKTFTAIINPPQSCILAVGASEKRIVANDKAPNGFETATIMSVTLSCDHRVVDGAVGAQWLQAFKGYIEEPETMLL